MFDTTPPGELPLFTDPQGPPYRDTPPSAFVPRLLAPLRRSEEPRCWKHLWLGARFSNAGFDVWRAARWEPLSPEARLGFARALLGTGERLRHALRHRPAEVRRDPFRWEGGLVYDDEIARACYLQDPDVPTHMLTPILAYL